MQSGVAWIDVPVDLLERNGLNPHPLRDAPGTELPACVWRDGLNSDRLKLEDSGRVFVHVVRRVPEASARWWRCAGRCGLRSLKGRLHDVLSLMSQPLPRRYAAEAACRHVAGQEVQAGTPMLR